MIRCSRCRVLGPWPDVALRKPSPRKPEVVMCAACADETGAPEVKVSEETRESLRDARGRGRR